MEGPRRKSESTDGRRIVRAIRRRRLSSRTSARGAEERCQVNKVNRAFFAQIAVEPLDVVKCPICKEEVHGMGAIQEHLGTHFLEVIGTVQGPGEADGGGEVQGQAEEADANEGEQDARQS